MPTAKPKISFYAQRRVADAINAIPKQVRSSWINRQLQRAIDLEQTPPDAPQITEVSRLRDWLNEHSNAQKNYRVICRVLTDYLADRPVEE